MTVTVANCSSSEYAVSCSRPASSDGTMPSHSSSPDSASSRACVCAREPLGGYTEKRPKEYKTHFARNHRTPLRLLPRSGQPVPRGYDVATVADVSTNLRNWESNNERWKEGFSDTTHTSRRASRCSCFCLAIAFFLLSSFF